MIPFILFYWFFSTLFCHGMTFGISETKVTAKDFLYAMLLGWLIFPLTLGTGFVQMHRKNDPDK
ncbi:MAG: hypothetical protein RI922_824 [Bacteroidota bacterium]|jgi:hypothetical protein